MDDSSETDLMTGHMEDDVKKQQSKRRANGQGNMQETVQDQQG